MAIGNLSRNIGSGSVYVDRHIEAPRWIPFGQNSLSPGDDPVIIDVDAHIISDPDDIASVARQGSFNSSVFAVTGSWAARNIQIVATPRATVTRNTKDSITFRATGVDPGGGLQAVVADNVYSLITVKEGVERVFWNGGFSRNYNEGGGADTIPLAQFISGIPDDTFDSVSIVSKSPDVPWITLSNASAANAALIVTPPSDISGNQLIYVILRVTRDTATPTTDDTTVAITILDILDPVTEGISIIGWDLPNGIQRGATFQVAVLLDQPLPNTDSLAASDFVADGLTGVTITGAAVDSSDNKRYILTCSTTQGIQGLVNFRYMAT